MNEHTERLEELRAILRDESLSYGELIELQGLAPYIEPGDVELLEAAGVPEFPEPYCNHDAPAVVNGVCECGAELEVDLDVLADGTPVGLVFTGTPEDHGDGVSRLSLSEDALLALRSALNYHFEDDE